MNLLVAAWIGGEEVTHALETIALKPDHGLKTIPLWDMVAAKVPTSKLQQGAFRENRDQ